MSTKAKQSIFGLLVFALLALITLVTMTSSEVTKARPNGFEFSVDTLVESETATHTIPQLIRNKTDYFWHVHVSQDSFATALTVILQESGWEDINRWYNKDTLSITAGGNYRFTGSTDAKRMQLLYQTDTTNQQIRAWSAANLTEGI